MWLTSGLLAAPANGTVLVDSGPLASGVYDVDAFGFSTEDDQGNPHRLVLEHRNMGNTASLMSQEFLTGLMLGPFWELRIDLNERIRVRTAAAVPGGISVRASLSFRKTRPAWP